MSRRRRYEMPLKKNSTFTLNITSMTDMFTIMLVFLLQSYSTSHVDLIPQEDIRLPSSNTMANPVEAVKLSLSEKELRLGSEKLAQLENADFISKDLESTDNNFIRPLFDELERLSKESPDADHIKQGRVLLQADQNLPYNVIRKVMYTASMAGYPQLKLVTIVGE